MALSKITTESLLDGEITTAKFATGVGGKVLQVISVHDITGRSQSLTSTATISITGLVAAITPSATSSKILISARWNGENSDVLRQSDAVLGILRDSTAIGLPSVSGNRFAGLTQVLSNPYQSNEAGSTMEGAMFEYLDSPNTTSATTYYITYRTSAGSTCTIYTNRSVADSDAGYVERLTSSITLWEISA
jgi:hypothetical protein